jgi:DNA-directed RNA polymerase specialized sigma24 family protein
MLRARGDHRVLGVDRAAALELLPDAYARALRLRDAGYGSAEIARRLGIAPEGVTTALELAEKKLARLLAQDELGSGHSPRPTAGPEAP